MRSISNHAETYQSESNVHAMRMGPGKHLKGLTLMNGIVQPEEVRVQLTSVLNEFIAVLNIRSSIISTRSVPTFLSSDPDIDEFPI